MAVAFIKGMQGDDPHYYKTIATAKHYAVHSGPEAVRHRFDVEPSERDLNETYLAAFRMSVLEGKVDSIMCAYNSVNGIPACANTDLLQKKLRDEWGFQGFIVSDCGAIRDIYAETAHRYTPDAASASALAVKAGTDLTCGTEYRSLLDAVKAGQITEAEINRSVVRLFVARLKLGMFDPPERVPFSKIPYAENDSAEHRLLALEAAGKSIVLLKNENGTLPLKPGLRRIVVIGPSADDPVAPLGNYNGFSLKQVTPLEGIESQYSGKAEVRYALGATYTTESQALVPVEALTPPTGTGHGLLAEYFDNPDFKGDARLRRVEPCIFQQAGMVDPAVAAAVPAPPMAGRGSGAPGRGAAPTASVRWTGSLRPPVTGDYVVSGGRGLGPAALRIYLDERELAAPNVAQAATAGSAGAGAGRGAPVPIRVHLEAARAYRLRVEYKTQGPNGSAQLQWQPPAEALLTQAVEAIKNADVAVAFVGLNPSLEGEEMRGVNLPGFEGGDRTDIKSPAPQERLLEAAIAAGKPVVVVLTSGSAVALNYAQEHASAVLALWYGGEEAGTAIAQTLAGINNPAGRLPVTFYRSVEQLPPFTDYSMRNRTYRYFAGDPLYGFGFGLSYSKFEHSSLRAQRTNKGAQISVRVKNTSSRSGDETVQLYVNGSGAPDDPIRQLRGFRRIHLRPGETREVVFSLSPQDVPKAKTRISVGGGQPVGGIPHLDVIL